MFSDVGFLFWTFGNVPRAPARQVTRDREVRDGLYMGNLHGNVTDIILEGVTIMVDQVLGNQEKILAKK